MSLTYTLSTWIIDLWQAWSFFTIEMAPPTAMARP